MEGNDFEHFYFMTNNEMASEKVGNTYEKRGNAEKYINTLKGHRETKNVMAFGHLILILFWANTLKKRALVSLYSN